MSKKFTINGREVEDYYLSNSDIVYLINSDKTSEEDKDYLMKKVYERFKYNLCPKSGEDNNDVFAHFFSNYVNRLPHDFKRAASTMSREHRELQNEMFKVCLEYIKKLAENCENGWFDPRNKYAAETSKKIIDYFKEIDYPY